MEEESNEQSPGTTRRATAKPKMDDEHSYLKKRERNNIAVRKSRMKAKERIEETRQRVVDLSKENEDLRSKVSLLQKELNVLRSLFSNGGICLPSAAELNVQLTSNGISSDDTSRDNGSDENVVSTTPVTLPTDVASVKVELQHE